MSSGSNSDDATEESVLSQSIKVATAAVAGMNNTRLATSFTSETREDLMELMVALAARDSAVDLYHCVVQLQYNERFMGLAKPVADVLLGACIMDLCEANLRLATVRNNLQGYLNAHMNTVLTRANMAMRQRTGDLLERLKAALGPEEYQIALNILNNTQQTQESRHFVI